MGSKVKPENSDSPRVSWDKGPSRRPRILLAASGSVAAIKFGILAESLCDWAEVKAVATKSALHFIDKRALPASVPLYTDEEEWSSWRKIGEEVLHIELRRWADALVIAPLSANTLAKVAGGLCDNLLTCVVRAWDFSKPVFIAPAMNTYMWDSPFTRRHLLAVQELGIILISPISKKLACGDLGNGAMEEPSVIDSTLRLALLKPMSYNAIVKAKRKRITDKREDERPAVEADLRRETLQALISTAVQALPEPAPGTPVAKTKSILCSNCDGNGVVACSQCKGDGLNITDHFNGRFKAGTICWLCRGKKQMLCGDCNGAGFLGGFMNAQDD